LWMFPTVSFSHTRNSITARCFWRTSKATAMIHLCHLREKDELSLNRSGTMYLCAVWIATR
jgi:hypothetical protein